jgi:predicted GIY-YIG superfamily endonuclease
MAATKAYRGGRGEGQGNCGETVASGNTAMSTDNTWFVYLLRCADGSLYTGITTNVLRRCEEHNVGTASRYTRSRRPITLVYQERQGSRSLALKRELVLKALSRVEKEALTRLAV